MMVKLYVLCGQVDWKEKKVRFHIQDAFQSLSSFRSQSSISKL